jgi:leader peptidase (prepilin peptidase)/N-methyltransferase
VDIAVMSVAGMLVRLASNRPTTRFVTRSRVDVASWALVSAVIGGLFGWRVGIGLVGVSVVVLGTGLVVLAEIDLRTRRLPREISYPLFAVTFSLVVVSAVQEGRPGRISDALAGVAIATVVLLVLHVASRGGMGDGDVRMAPALGTFGLMGGVPTVWTGLLFAFVSAGVCVTALMIVGRANRFSTIPFGPFLIGGAITAALISGR